MVTVRRRVLLPLLALILVPDVFFVLAPNPIQAGETPSFLMATAAPTERLSPPVTWLDHLENRLTTYFTKKYPAYDFAPYAQELDRIRGALSLGDHHIYYLPEQGIHLRGLKIQIDGPGKIYHVLE